MVGRDPSDMWRKEYDNDMGNIYNHYIEELIGIDHMGKISATLTFNVMGKKKTLMIDYCRLVLHRTTKRTIDNGT